MACVFKHPESKYWFARYFNKDNRRVNRSTKQTDKRAARRIADEWERMEKVARQSTITTVQVQKVLNDLLERVNEETIKSDSIKKYLTDWLKTVKAKSSDGTFRRYESTVNFFLKSLNGSANSPITSATSQHIENFMTSRLDEGCSAKTVQIDIKILNSAFNRAEKYGVILKNPCTAVELPKVHSSERGTFTQEQVLKLLETATKDNDWYTAILIGYSTGQRLNDCVTLKWTKINFETLTVTFKQKKTGREIQIPMTRELAAHLETLDRKTEFVCPTLAGRVSGGAHGLSESFNRIVKKAGINAGNTEVEGSKNKFTKLTFHSLRHTFNTALADENVDQETRMQLTGHSSRAMNDRYTRKNMTKLQVAIEALPSLFPKSRPAEMEITFKDL